MDHSLQSCVNVIHIDLVEIWNINDKTRVSRYLGCLSIVLVTYGSQYLSSDGFKAKMSHLVKDFVEPVSMISE